MHIDCDSPPPFSPFSLSLSCRPQRHRSSTLDRRHLSCLLSHILHAAPPCTWWAHRACWENPPVTLLVVVVVHKYELCVPVFFNEGFGIMYILLLFSSQTKKPKLNILDGLSHVGHRPAVQGHFLSSSMFYNCPCTPTVWPKGKSAPYWLRSSIFLPKDEILVIASLALIISTCFFFSTKKFVSSSFAFLFFFFLLLQQIQLLLSASVQTWNMWTRAESF